MKQHAAVADDDSVKGDQVVEYLLRHRDFFDHHPDLLEKLHLPHPSGEAVSLVARQLDLLREKNRTVQEQLESLVRIARENDDLSGKMHQLALVLLEAETFQDALRMLTQRLRDCFLADWVGVRIVLDHNGEPSGPVFVSPDDERLQRFRKTLQSGTPKCGCIDAEQAGFLFGEQTEPIGSCAIVPLRSFEQGGLLAIGSREKSRFHPGMGHLFLQQMGEIVSNRLCKLLAMER
jgi:uncharacterized protein